MKKVQLRREKKGGNSILFKKEEVKNYFGDVVK